MSGMADRTCCLPGSCKFPLFISSEELLLSFVRLYTVTKTPAPIHPISPFPFRPILLISKALYSFPHFSPLTESSSILVLPQPRSRACLGLCYLACFHYRYTELNRAPCACCHVRSWFQVNRWMPKSSVQWSILQGSPATVEYRAFLKCLFVFMESVCSLIPALCITVSHQNTSCPVVFKNIRFFFSSKSNNTYQLLLKYHISSLSLAVYSSCR